MKIKSNVKRELPGYFRGSLEEATTMAREALSLHLYGFIFSLGIYLRNAKRTGCESEYQVLDRIQLNSKIPHGEISLG